MREELGSQFDIDNVHMERIITKVREKRKMRTNLTHFPIDDGIGQGQPYPRGIGLSLCALISKLKELELNIFLCWTVPVSP